MNEKNPFFSIVIPVHNSEKYLRQCIESVINQNFKDYEIIFVDDGSKDSSTSLISKYANKYPKFKIIKKKCSGVSSTRNVGLNCVVGKYVIFLDSDDYLLSDSMSYLKDILLDNEDVDILLFNYVQKLVSGLKKHMILPGFLGNRISNTLAIKSVLSRNGHQGFCWNKVYKSSLVTNIRFDEDISYLEDMLFNVSCLSRAIHVMSISKCIYCYRWRSNSVVNEFSLNQLSIFTALNKIEKILPYDFEESISLKRKIFCIEFGSQLFKKNKYNYSKVKNIYNMEKKAKRICKLDLGKTDKLVLFLGNMNFTLAVIAFMNIKGIRRFLNE